MAIEPQRSEIWRVNLNPTRGDEIAKTRPCVVLSRARTGRLNLHIVVPVTDWKDRYADYFWMSRLEPSAENGLTKTSAADVFQVRSVSAERFVERIGVLPDERVERIVTALGICVR